MRQATLALAACVVLAGCQSVGTDHLKGSARTCLTENGRFSDAWSCIRARYASGQISGADPRLPAFLAKGDRLAAAVDAGRAYDIEARNELSEALRRELAE